MKNNRGECLMDSLLPIAILALVLALIVPGCLKACAKAKANRPVPTLESK